MNKRRLRTEALEGRRLLTASSLQSTDSSLNEHQADSTESGAETYTIATSRGAVEQSLSPLAVDLALAEGEQTPVNRYARDVNDSGTVTGLDALQVINHFGSDDPQFDVNDDGNVLASDALNIINELGRQGGEVTLPPDITVTDESDLFFLADNTVPAGYRFTAQIIEARSSGVRDRLANSIDLLVSDPAVIDSIRVLTDVPSINRSDIFRTAGEVEVNDTQISIPIEELRIEAGRTQTIGIIAIAAPGVTEDSTVQFDVTNVGLASGKEVALGDDVSSDEFTIGESDGGSAEVTEDPAPESINLGVQSTIASGTINISGAENGIRSLIVDFNEAGLKAADFETYRLFINGQQFVGSEVHVLSDSSVQFTNVSFTNSPELNEGENEFEVTARPLARGSFEVTVSEHSQLSPAERATRTFGTPLIVTADTATTKVV